MRTDYEYPEPVVISKTRTRSGKKYEINDQLSQLSERNVKKNGKTVYLKTPVPHPPKYETSRGAKSRAGFNP